MNSQLTRKVIELHNKGYELDFVVERTGRLICIQTNHGFEPDSVLVILVQQAFDQWSKSFKYVHTVETPSGDKGLLLSECVQLTLIYPHILRDYSAYAITNL